MIIENPNLNFAGSGGDEGGGGSQIVPNSIFSTASLRVLDLVSEGQVGGLVDGARSIFFNGVPLQNKNGTFNFNDIWVDGVTGTPHQKVLEGYGEVVTPKNVGIEVKEDAPVVVTIDNIEADLIRPVVHLNSLSESDNRGNVDEASVSFRFELAINDSGDWENLGDFTISGKQNNTYQKSYEFKLPKKDKNGKPPRQWLLKMTRLSKDSDEKYQSKTYFNSVFIVTSSKLSYPHSAVIGIKANAKNLGRIPTRSYLIDGLLIEIPSNYDPKENKYEGIWDGTFKFAVSSNPAWILYALLTNKRWGLGNYISKDQVNVGKIYEIGRYCDEEVDDGFGGKEKRFTVNTQIRKRSEAYRLIGDICAVFRGMTYWANGMADITCDRPTDPSMVYTPANVIDGQFTYTGTGKNERHSVCLVTWNDPEQNYKQVVEYVEDNDLIAKYGFKQAEFTAFGCTSRGQAIRAGKWVLYTEAYETNSVTFSVGLDSSLVLPGDVVQIQDPVLSGKRNGGRIIEAGVNYAIIDQEVELQVGNDTVFSIRMPDGSFIERDVIVSADRAYQRIEWNEPLPELPTENAIWVMSEKTLQTQLARVVNIEQGEDRNSYKITAVIHEPKKYDLVEKGIQIEARPTSIVDPYSVEQISKFDVKEVTKTLNFGLVESRLVVAWTPVPTSMSYEIRWKNSTDDEWHMEKTSSSSFEIDRVVAGTYTFQVTSIGLMGTKSEPKEFFYRATGKYLTPLDVREFYIVKRPSYLELHWGEVKDAYAYEVRCGTSWDEAEVLTTGFKGTTMVHYQTKAGKYNYHIRAITVDGTYSPNITTTVLDLRAPATPEDLTAVIHENRIDFFWKRNREDDINFYELREGQSWSSGVKVAESKVSQMSIPSGSKSRRKFWLKAIALPKIYSDEAAWVEINIENDQSKNIIISHNAKMLSWDGNKIGMKISGDDLVMNPTSFHSEYIKHCDLPESINAVNSFYTTVGATIRGDVNDINWEQAKFNWSSSEAKRAWRLGVAGNDTTYENQISLKTVNGFNSGEYESWSLDETLTATSGAEAITQKHIVYDWGRYRKGLKLLDTSSVVWNTKNLKGKESNFKISFWFKPFSYESGTTYLICKIGNDNNELSVTYDTDLKCFKLSDTKGNSICVKYDYIIDESYLIAISQNKTERTFAVGTLNGKIEIEKSTIEPVGNIDFIKVGSV